MEQILYAGNWELDLRFPGKKAGVAIFLLLSLCLLGVNAHSFSMHRTSRSSGGEGTSVYGKEPVYEEEGISDIRKDLITQIKMDRAGFDLTGPAGESTSGAGENLEVARKEVKRVDDKMTAASESLGGVIPNTGTTDTADIIPVSVQIHYYGNGPAGGFLRYLPDDSDGFLHSGYYCYAGCYLDDYFCFPVSYCLLYLCCLPDDYPGVYFLFSVPGQFSPAAGFFACVPACGLHFEGGIPE